MRVDHIQPQDLVELQVTDRVPYSEMLELADGHHPLPTALPHSRLAPRDSPRPRTDARRNYTNRRHDGAPTQSQHHHLPPAPPRPRSDARPPGRRFAAKQKSGSWLLHFHEQATHHGRPTRTRATRPKRERGPSRPRSWTTDSVGAIRADRCPLPVPQAERQCRIALRHQLWKSSNATTRPPTSSVLAIPGGASAFAASSAGACFWVKSGGLALTAAAATEENSACLARRTSALARLLAAGLLALHVRVRGFRA